MAARLVAAEDAVRRQIERDLHDGAQQRLVMAALGIRLAQAKLGPAADPEVAELLTNGLAMLDTAVRELRELASGVRPAILTDAGLVAALRSLAMRTPIPVSVSAPDDLPRLAPAVEAAGYFVVAEALTNAAKHADATRVAVVLTRYAERLLIEVTDDGLGGVVTGRGSGLLGLRDRLEAVGGGLRVRSRAGRGTTVSAVLPAVPATSTA